MKILILHTGPLIAHDDGRIYVKKLCTVLAESGHSIESTSIPFSGAIGDVVSQCIAYRLFDVAHTSDLCIAVGPFSHAFAHQNKRVWVLSQYSPLYEHWNTRYGANSANASHRSTREYVLAADRAWLSEARVVCAASHKLSQALLNHHGRRAQVLPPSLPEEHRPTSIEYGGYFLAVVSPGDAARVSLVLDAFTKTLGHAHLVIVGFGCTVYEQEYLERLVARSVKADWITLEINPSYDRVFQYVASAFAMVSTPFCSSALDIFSIAAGSSQKPILTTTDSGELATLIDHTTDGYVVEPSASTLAYAMDEVFADKNIAVKLGKRLAEKLSSMLPSWPSIAAELTT